MVGERFSRQDAMPLGMRVLAIVTAIALVVILAVTIDAGGFDPYLSKTQIAKQTTEQVTDEGETPAANSAAGEPASEISFAKATQDSDASDDEAEAIDDEGNPLSSGLGGGEPVSGGAGFGGVVIVGIALVALGFVLGMRRLNGSIKDMSRMFK